VNIKNIILYILLFNSIVINLIAVDLEIDIFNPKYKSIEIIFSESINENKLCNNYNKNIIDIVKADLENSGAFLFNVSNEVNIKFNKEEDTFEIISIPYDNYDILVSTNCTYDKENEFYIIKSVAFNKNNEIIFTNLYKVNINKIDKRNIQYLSHLISSDVYKNLLGINGYFIKFL
jgi:hypothetical protein